MYRILTQKQENFCLNIVQGLTQRESWINAGYSSKYSMTAVDIHACQLAGKDRIKIRITELRGEIATAVKSNQIADIEERQKILTEITRGRLSQFTDDAGVIDRKKLDSSAIQAIDQQQVMGKMATVTKLRLHNPITAIAELNKMDHVYEDRGNGGTNIYVNRVEVYSQGGGKPFRQLIEGKTEEG